MCSTLNKKCSTGNRKCSRTKNVRSENCSKLNRKLRVKMTQSSLYIFTAICGLERPILYCLLWYSIALHGLFWCCLVFYGIVWPFIAVYGFMARYRIGLVWSFLAVRDPNSYREPDFQIVYTFVDAKNTVQPAVPIQSGFAQEVAWSEPYMKWTLLDPQGQVQKEPYFAIKIILTSLKQWFFD